MSRRERKLRDLKEKEKKANVSEKIGGIREIREISSEPVVVKISPVKFPDRFGEKRSKKEKEGEIEQFSEEEALKEDRPEKDRPETKEISIIEPEYGEKFLGLEDYFEDVPSKMKTEFRGSGSDFYKAAAGGPKDFYKESSGGGNLYENGSGQNLYNADSESRLYSGIGGDATEEPKLYSFRGNEDRETGELRHANASGLEITGLKKGFSNTYDEVKKHKYSDEA